MRAWLSDGKVSVKHNNITTMEKEEIKRVFDDVLRHPLEWGKPLYCDVTQVNTEISGVNIKTYEVTIEE